MFIPELVLIIICSVWLPQIISNACYNTKGVPDLKFAVCIQVHLAFVPLYFMGSDNFLKFRPKKDEWTICLLWMCF